MFPCIRQDFSLQDWRSVGRILVKVYKALKYFPLPLSKNFVIVTIFCEHVLSNDELMEGFSLYSIRRYHCFEKAINQESLIKEDWNDVIDILSAVSSRRTFCTNTELKHY